MQILYGWVPNLSGFVCGRKRLESKIKEWNNLAGRRNDITFRFKSRVENGLIMVDAVANGKKACTIQVIDPAGMCRVVIDDGKRPKRYANLVWTEFRIMLDGSMATVYQCTAVNRLIPARTTDNGLEVVAWNFIRTMESDADFSAHVIDRKYSRTDDHDSPSYITKARYSANKLYFDAFIDFYGTRMNETRCAMLRNEMERRVEKNAIAVDYLEQRYHRSYNRWALFVASVAVIISAAAFVSSLT